MNEKSEKTGTPSEQIEAELQRDDFLKRRELREPILKHLKQVAFFLSEKKSGMNAYAGLEQAKMYFNQNLVPLGCGVEEGFFNRPVFNIGEIEKEIREAIKNLEMKDAGIIALDS